MITGAIKSQVARLWDAFWTGLRGGQVTKTEVTPTTRDPVEESSFAGRAWASDHPPNSQLYVFCYVRKARIDYLAFLKKIHITMNQKEFTEEQIMYISGTTFVVDLAGQKCPGVPSLRSIR